MESNHRDDPVGYKIYIQFVRFQTLEKVSFQIMIIYHRDTFLHKYSIITIIYYITTL